MNVDKLGSEYVETWKIRCCLSESLDDYLTNHASTTVGLAIEIEGTCLTEGFFPRFAGGECQVGVAVLVVTFKDGVMGSHLVVDELDGVTGFDRDGTGLESQHSGICAKFHLNGGCTGGSYPDREGQHQGKGSVEKRFNALQHDDC